MRSPAQSTGSVPRVHRSASAILRSVSVIRAFIKLAVLVALLGLVAAVIAVVSRGRNAQPVSFDEWPTVPRKPVA